MVEIALVFGSDTGNTEEVALQIQSACDWAEIEIFDVAMLAPEDIEGYEVVILGVPTWDCGGIQTDWEEYWPVLETMDFTGKTVALYGLGDQFSYGQYYLDAMGLLHDAVVERGAKTIGYTSTDGYEFDSSMAAIEDGARFVGLGLDEEHQMDQTEPRIANWLDQLKAELD